MTNISTQAAVTKSLIIGKAWDNGESVSPTGVPQPRLKMKVSRDLGLNITIVPNTEFAFWDNPKREGRQDPDYSVSVQLPADIVDTEIARQQAAKASA